MTLVRRALAAAAVVALAPPAAQVARAGEMHPEIDVPRRDACRSWVPGNPVANVKSVEVCVTGADAAAALRAFVPDPACPTCVSLYSPTTRARVYPVYVRIRFANGTMVQQQSPETTVDDAMPSPRCLVDTTGGATTCPV